MSLKILKKILESSLKMSQRRLADLSSIFIIKVSNSFILGWELYQLIRVKSLLRALTNKRRVNVENGSTVVRFVANTRKFYY